MTYSRIVLVGILSSASAVFAQPAQQTQADDYTRYELLAPGTAKFRILYEVTATIAGAEYFFNAIRRGSVASDESVTDIATGISLELWCGISAQGCARLKGSPR